MSAVELIASVLCKVLRVAQVSVYIRKVVEPYFRNAVVIRLPALLGFRQRMALDIFADVLLTNRCHAVDQARERRASTCRTPHA